MENDPHQLVPQRWGMIHGAPKEHPEFWERLAARKRWITDFSEILPLVPAPRVDCTRRLP